MAVVGPALGVLAEQPLELGAAEEAAVAPPSSRSSATARSSSRNQRSSGTPKPVLPAPGDLGGRSAANACLSATLPKASSRGQREAELDDAVVEERRAQLERDRHRGDVRLRQQVAREVRLDVDEAQVVGRPEAASRSRARAPRPSRAGGAARAGRPRRGARSGRPARRRRPRGSGGRGRASSAARGVPRAGRARPVRGRLERAPASACAR